MSFKKLFFTEDEPKTEKPVTEKPSFSKLESAPSTFPNAPTFPLQQPNTPTFAQPSQPISCEPQKEQLMDVFKQRFNDLNKPGYDFYEFYKTIEAQGFNNTMAYKMAFDMARILDGNLSKDSLISDAEYYIQELTNSYNELISKGSSKKESLTLQMTNEQQELNDKYSELQKRKMEIEAEIQKVTVDITNLPGKYQPLLFDVDCKLQGTDAAKTEILSNINTVVNNIKLNT